LIEKTKLFILDPSLFPLYLLLPNPKLLLNVEIKEIRTLIDLMKKNGLAVFKMEEGDFKITLKTPEGAMGGAGAPTFVQGVAPVPAQAPIAASAAAPASASAPEVVKDWQEIRSPMVGTFYAAASPESPAFAKVGSTVSADTVVCIIEAMKVMNEIKAEISGTIIEVVAENGKPVQFGDVLFKVK
jgi:acetyl-CoA carboxylase biotin carboxyl carrier protein